MIPYQPHVTGKRAEDEACRFLQGQGLQLLVQNFSYPQGEIDLIMQDGEYIVFVEVRERGRSDYGNALESINIFKQRKIIKTANYYLRKQNWLNKVYLRFDAVIFQPVAGKRTLEWLKNAFWVDG